MQTAAEMQQLAARVHSTQGGVERLASSWTVSEERLRGQVGDLANLTHTQVQSLAEELHQLKRKVGQVDDMARKAMEVSKGTEAARDEVAGLADHCQANFARMDQAGSALDARVARLGVEMATREDLGAVFVGVKEALERLDTSTGVLAASNEALTRENAVLKEDLAALRAQMDRMVEWSDKVTRTLNRREKREIVSDVTISASTPETPPRGNSDARRQQRSLPCQARRVRQQRVVPRCP
jgi:chromosome segregation ATPase